MTTTLEISIDCCLCSNKHLAEIVLPPGWEHRYFAVDDEVGFCPDHAKVAAFAEEQCPGCVGGWGSCSMWQAFAYSTNRSMTERDYAALESGRCPRRTNGTTQIDRDRGTMTELDLSNLATIESGKAFAQAIRDYIAAYPERGLIGGG